MHPPHKGLRQPSAKVLIVICISKTGEESERTHIWGVF